MFLQRMSEMQPPETLPEAVSLSVVLPAYNEVASLRNLLPEIVAVCASGDRHPFEVVVVDDGSTDETAAVASEAAHRYEQVRLVTLDGNFGQSAALAAGFDAADGEVVVAMDADGQNDPHDIPRLLARYDDGPDVVSGWRKDRDDPLAKRIPSRVQTTLAKLTGPDIHDFGCTLTAYDAGALDELDLRGERHRYIPSQLYHRGYDIDEVGVEHHPREHGQSHYGVGRLLRGALDLGYQVFRTRWRARPIHFFGGLGTLIAGAGLCLGLWLLALRYGAGRALATMLPRLLFSVALVLFGSGMAGLGIVTELLTEILYKDERPYRVAEVVE